MYLNFHCPITAIVVWQPWSNKLFPSKAQVDTMHQASPLIGVCGCVVFALSLDDQFAVTIMMRILVVIWDNKGFVLPPN